MALALVTELGVATEDPLVESFADEFFASVSVLERFDGIPAPIGYEFGYGAEGRLVWASGSFAEPQRVGPYPLIDLDAAIARLEEMNSWFGVSIPSAPAPEPAPADEAATSGVVESPSADAVEGDAADEAAPSEPEPEPEPEPVPEPEPLPVEPVDEVDDGGEIVPLPEPSPVEPVDPIVVVLVDVEADLWWTSNPDGSIVMLPAYRFIDADGGWHVVPAVTDEFFQVAPPETFLDDPVVQEPAAREPLEEPVDEPSTGAPADSTGVFEELSAVGPGLTIDEFEALAAQAGFTVRVVERDGVALAVTEDLRTDRINVSVDAGDVIVEVVSVG